MSFVFLSNGTKEVSIPKPTNQSQRMSSMNARVSSKCKVCFDARKDEKMYMSHRTKDAMGAVICPTLLNQACLRCKKKGHTVSRCTVRLEKREPSVNLSASVVASAANKHQSRFTILDEEEEEERKPTVCVEIQMNKKSYAAIVSQLQKPKATITATVTVAPAAPVAPVAAAAAADAKAKTTPVKRKIINWADMDSDSDSD